MSPGWNGNWLAHVGCRALVVLMVAVWPRLEASEQDVVLAASSADPNLTVKREGEILDFTGKELRLRTALGSQEVIPAARVVEVRTRWSPPHEAGRKARAAGDLEQAIAALRQAKRDESRPWVVRQIMAELSGCYLEAGRIDAAGDEFLAIVASDPTTRHLAVVPVAWRAGPPGTALEARASAWLAARQTPIAVVLGASWLLPTSERLQAVAALEELSSSTDASIRALATIQLWRTRFTAPLGEVRRWEAQLAAFPAEVQAAGWYVVGEALARHSQHEQAALAFLKPPLVFREQRALAADGLLAAGKQLEKLQQAEHARRLYRELVRDFPASPAAAEAQERIGNGNVE